MTPTAREVVAARSQPDDSVDEFDTSPLDAIWARGGDVTAALTRFVASHPNRHGLFTNILARLEDSAFGREVTAKRSLRSIYVEAVLLGGYPWALQLEPADVVAVRTTRRTGRPARFLLAAALGAFLVGLAVAAIMVPRPLRLEPTAAERALDDVRPRLSELKRFDVVRAGAPTVKRTVEETVTLTADTMRALVADGHAERAIALGHACVLFFHATRPCMVMLASAHEHAPVPDVAKAKQWYALSQRQDVVERTREARALADSALARDWTEVGGTPKGYEADPRDAHALMQHLMTLAKDPCPGGVCQPHSKYFLP